MTPLWLPLAAAGGGAVRTARRKATARMAAERVIYAAILRIGPCCLPDHCHAVHADASRALADAVDRPAGPCGKACLSDDACLRGGRDMSRAEHTELRLRASLWLGVGERDLGGPERIALLEAIAERGSITAAARALGMSYKAAWDAVDLMNQLAGGALVVGCAGGRGGGGTRLTERGARLVASYRLLDAEHRRFLATLAEPARHALDDLPLIRSLAMHTSARNQFSATVSAVRRGAVNDEVELDVAPGLRIVAVITHGSAEALGLAPGARALALVKASSVVLVAGGDALRVSARNRLAGTVREVREGMVNADVTLELPGGITLGAVVTLESARALGLAPGAAVTAIFKASSVIVAVPA